MGFVGNSLPCFHENMRLVFFCFSLEFEKEKFETKMKEEVVVFRT